MAYRLEKIAYKLMSDLNKKFPTYNSKNVSDFNKVSKYLKSQMPSVSGIKLGLIATDYHDYRSGDMGVKIPTMKKLALTLKRLGVKESVDEGKFSKIMKSVRKGTKSGPWDIIVSKNNKIAKRVSVKNLKEIPAEYADIKKKYPNHKIGIEAKDGKIVYRESINKGANPTKMIELYAPIVKGSMNNMKLAVKKKDYKKLKKFYQQFNFYSKKVLGFAKELM